ncbi:hypothetical protein [Streptomyces sp. NPDC046909]|uniref:hypothetical protein n=1 Tax=Streptomyces sp. NPDC046909 TaxID=3155617 RepID=UPI0033E50303
MSNIRQPLYGEAAVQVRDQLATSTAEDIRQHADQQTPDAGREHTEHQGDDLGLSLAEVLAALPAVADHAMKTALPERYTPELAAEFAQTMAGILREQQQERPVTAAQRGPEWMAKWGCPGFCVERHGTSGAMECHSTAPVETTLKAAEVDCSGYSENGESLPWMTAQVIVNNDKAQAYGRETKVWLGYGVHLAELPPAEARRALDALRGFTVRLAAVVDFAEQVAADDFAGDPEIAAADREAEARRVRAITEGTR